MSVREWFRTSFFNPRHVLRQIGGPVPVILVVIAEGIWICHKFPASSAPSLIGWTFACFCCGVFVGITEIISKYRDAPIHVLDNPFSIIYIGINGIVSVFAFGVLLHYTDKVLPILKGDLFMTTMAAGFGAMGLLRSKFFTLHTANGEEISAGPILVLEALLKTVQTEIDRWRATERLDKVLKGMQGVTNFDLIAQFMQASLLAFQNLDERTKADFVALAEEYRETTLWPEVLKTAALGFAFLTLAGEEYFDKMLEGLRIVTAESRGGQNGGASGNNPKPADGKTEPPKPPVVSGTTDRAPDPKPVENLGPEGNPPKP